MALVFVTVTYHVFLVKDFEKPLPFKTFTRRRIVWWKKFAPLSRVLYSATTRARPLERVNQSKRYLRTKDNETLLFDLLVSILNFVRFSMVSIWLLHNDFQAKCFQVRFINYQDNSPTRTESLRGRLNL